VRRPRKRDNASGQATAEYAVLLGAVAIGCIIAISALSRLIDGLFEAPTPVPAQQPFTPPAARAGAHLPTSLEDCRDEGWRNYVGLTSQADCEAFVTGSPAS